MAYKTILVHMDNSGQDESRIAVAASLAQLEPDSHVIGAAMTGISRFVFESASSGRDGGESLSFIDSHIVRLREEASKVLDRFDAAALQAGIGSSERRLVDDESHGGISLQARYADLVVLGQENPDNPNAGSATGLPEHVAMTSGRPVLVLPYAGKPSCPFNNILVAWNASLEVTRAIHHALPLLRRADKVRIAVLNPSRQPDMHGEEPGADIALYLSRQNVNVEIVHQEAQIDIGNALLSLAADSQSDLLVMGCYGHTRFKEILLGGVSRTILQTMTIPVFMVH